MGGILIFKVFFFRFFCKNFEDLKNCKKNSPIADIEYSIDAPFCVIVTRWILIFELLNITLGKGIPELNICFSQEGLYTT
jgi:hypothetical protein